MPTTFLTTIELSMQTLVITPVTILFGNYNMVLYIIYKQGNYKGKNKKLHSYDAFSILGQGSFGLVSEKIPIYHQFNFYLVSNYLILFKGLSGYEQ